MSKCILPAGSFAREEAGEDSMLVGRRQTQYARLSLVKRSLILSFCAAAVALFVAAPVVSAHEHDVYRVEAPITS